MNLSKRNTALDIVRIVAFFSVLGIHFWLYTGYYEQTMVGPGMLIFTSIRSAFSCCVPLFIILSGYLLNGKTLSKRYYSGIIKILGIYALASVSCMVFKHLYFGDELTFRLIFFSLFDFKGANYAWYIEMYVGLFLLIPFINVMYHGMKSQGQKKVLIWTLICLTALPSIINIYNFIEPGWFQNPTISDSYQKLVSNWWINLYPITYYMIGAYLKEYPFRMKKRYTLLLFIVMAFLFGLFNFYRDYGRNYSWGIYTEWYSVQALVLSVLMFSFLSRQNTQRYPTVVKKVLAHLSDLCLGAYLMSYISDCTIYPYLWKIAPDLTDKAMFFVPMLLIGGIISLLLSECLHLIYKLLQWIIVSLRGTTRTKSNTKELTKTM